MYHITRVSEILKTLSDPYRMRIINLVIHAPSNTLYVAKICRIIGVPYNGGSNKIVDHLYYLRQKNIVAYYTDKQTNRNWYYLCLTGELKDYVYQMVGFWKQHCHEMQADLHRLHHEDQIPSDETIVSFKI